MDGQADCQAIRSRFLALEEGRLGPEAARAVAEHLGTCDACRGEWQAWQDDDRRLRDALQPEAPPRDLAAAAVARLRAERGTDIRGRRRHRVRWAVAVAAVAAIALGIVAYRSWGEGPIGEIEVAEGRPTLKQPGDGEPLFAEVAKPVYNGAELHAAPGDRLAVRFREGSRLTLSPGTKVTLSGPGHFGQCGHFLPHVCLHYGEVVCELESLRHFRAVGTPLGTAIIEGTKFRIKYVSGQRTVLEVLEGEVQFSCPGGEVRAVAGTTWVTDSRELLPRKVSGVFD